jgi:hypothetical protein
MDEKDLRLDIEDHYLMACKVVVKDLKVRCSKMEQDCVLLLIIFLVILQKLTNRCKE